MHGWRKIKNICRISKGRETEQGVCMMGKHSKKMKKQAQKNSDAKKIQQCQVLESDLVEVFAAEEYAKSLEILAELIQVGDIKPDLLYKGAYSYFMLGDYERAAQWVSNTLNYDPQHVEARILLARLCFIQDRHEDGLSIYEFLVQNYRQTMTAEQKEQIKDSSAYYVRREPEKVRGRYPALADFLQLEAAAEKDVPAAEQNTPAGGSALSALQRLKAKLQAVQAKNEQESAANEPAVPAEPVKTAEVTEAIPAEAENCADAELERQIAEIQKKPCSSSKKIRLLNNFAAAAYMAADYASAAAYLKVALQLDDEQEQTIRNMAMTQAALGNIETAQKLAASLPVADFVLLQMIRENPHG